jgi:Rrf2 family protein
MMKVSTRSTYAIRALLWLARSGAQETVALGRVAETQRIPLPFLEAVRGPQGGYRLGRAAGEITLAQIINALEGPTQPVLCTMPENRAPDCHEKDGCVSRLLCCEIDGALNQILSNKTLASMNDQAGNLHSAPVRFKK